MLSYWRTEHDSGQPAVAAAALLILPISDTATRLNRLRLAKLSMRRECASIVEQIQSVKFYRKDPKTGGYFVCRRSVAWGGGEVCAFPRRSGALGL